jgi:hypothetical protein
MLRAQQAQRREKQGDAWCSLRQADGSYTQVLRIPHGEEAAGDEGIVDVD